MEITRHPIVAHTQSYPYLVSGEFYTTPIYHLGKFKEFYLLVYFYFFLLLLACCAYKLL